MGTSLYRAHATLIYWIWDIGVHAEPGVSEYRRKTTPNDVGQYPAVIDVVA
jgi:hypothetical protein